MARGCRDAGNHRQGRSCRGREVRRLPRRDAIGKARARLTVEQIRNRLDEKRALAAEPEARPPRREPKLRQEEGFAHRLDDDRQPQNQPRPAVEGEQQRFAHILDNPEKLRKLREKTEQQDRKLGRHMRKSRGLSF